MYESPRGPSSEEQRQIYSLLEEAATDEDLVHVLRVIGDLAASDLLQLGEREEISPEEGSEILAAVEAWASLASGAVMDFSLTERPPEGEVTAHRFLRKIVPGWRKPVTAQLRQVANTLGPALMAARDALAATSFSVSVGFPWGIAIGLSWDAHQWMLKPIEGTTQMILEVVSPGSRPSSP